MVTHYAIGRANNGVQREFPFWNPFKARTKQAITSKVLAIFCFTENKKANANLTKGKGIFNLPLVIFYNQIS